jgi:glucose-1-phosphate cytidylyltransferase
MMVVPPQGSFHCVELNAAGTVDTIVPVNNLPIWENGGYFVLRQEVFDHLQPGSDLVADACGALAKGGRLLAYQYRGYWQPADTVKERAALDAGYAAGDRPWMLWENGSAH